MPYIKETCVAGDTIEVCKYYTYRVNVKGEKRAKKEKQTSEAQKKVNQRKAEKELRRLMAANYKNGDVVVRLDFFRRPGGSEEMQPLIEKAIRKLRSAYRRAGKQLKYIYVKEVGPRGSRHIHMILNREEMDVLSLLAKCWPHGGIHVDPWTTGPNFQKLAAYFIKYALKTEETEGKLIGKRWYPSRNLKKPSVRKEVIRSNRFREQYIREFLILQDTGISHTHSSGRGADKWTRSTFTYTQRSEDREQSPGATPTCWNISQIEVRPL